MSENQWDIREWLYQTLPVPPHIPQRKEKIYPVYPEITEYWGKVHQNSQEQKSVIVHSSPFSYPQRSTIDGTTALYLTFLFVTSFTKQCHKIGKDRLEILRYCYRVACLRMQMNRTNMASSGSISVNDSHKISKNWEWGCYHSASTHSWHR